MMTGDVLISAAHNRYLTVKRIDILMEQSVEEDYKTIHDESQYVVYAKCGFYQFNI